MPASPLSCWPARSWASCRPAPPPTPPDEAARKRAFTDALYDVMSADREIYTKEVVNRLQNEEKVLKATEHWKDDKTLPLPAQMFRMGAERVRERTKAFTYSLLSLDPINKQNRPRTDAEKAGSGRGVAGPTATTTPTRRWARPATSPPIYPDKAVSQACVDCHNGHPDSPRKDFKLGDVMGGIVIRVAQAR